MTDKEKTIKELKEVLDSLDITNEYRLNLIKAIEYLQEEPVSEKKCMFTKDSYTDEDRKVLCEDCEEKCEYSKNSRRLYMETNINTNLSDLEEAANDYSIYDAKIEAFKAGAQWQKEKFVTWLIRESDFLTQELKKGNKAYGLPEQYRAQLYKEIINKLKEE